MHGARCANYCDKYVCLSLCSHNSKTTGPNFTMWGLLPVAVARSSSDTFAIGYVLPVLWMTSCFHTIKPKGQNQTRRYVQGKFARWRYQFDVKITAAFGFWSSSSECGTRDKVCHQRLTYSVVVGRSLICVDPATVYVTTQTDDHSNKRQTTVYNNSPSFVNSCTNELINKLYRQKKNAQCPVLLRQPL